MRRSPYWSRRQCYLPRKLNTTVVVQDGVGFFCHFIRLLVASPERRFQKILDPAVAVFKRESEDETVKRRDASDGVYRLKIAQDSNTRHKMMTDFCNSIHSLKIQSALYLERGNWAYCGADET